MNNDKFMSLMGIARKAGKITFGNDVVTESVLKRKTKLIILASDLSPRSTRGMELLAQKHNVKLFRIDHNMRDIYKAIGKETGIISVEDDGFAKKMIELLSSD